MKGVSPTNNYGAGIFGTSASNVGVGVWGENTNSSGGATPVGGYFTSAAGGGGTGYAVKAVIGNGTNTGYGVYSNQTGLNNTGWAIYGLNDGGGNGNGAVNWGGYFETTTTAAGYGVEGVISGAGNTGYAGYFENTATSGANYGVYAVTNAGTPAIYGVSHNGFGPSAIFAADSFNFDVVQSGYLNPAFRMYLSNGCCSYLEGMDGNGGYFIKPGDNINGGYTVHFILTSLETFNWEVIIMWAAAPT